MTSVKSVAVMGTGMAGRACALAAASVGVPVDLYEVHSDSQVRDVHIEVVPHMLRALATLGVADQCVAAGFPFNGIDLVDCRGRTMTQLPTPRLAGARLPPALGIARSALQDILLKEGLDKGVKLHSGSPVTVTNESGNWAFHCAGARLPHADVVILAIGATSPLRSLLFPAAPPVTLYPLSWWYAQVDRPPGLKRPRFVVGPERRKSSLMPVSARTASLVYMHQGFVSHADAGLAEEFRRAFDGFPAPECELAQRIGADALVTAHPVRSMLMSQPWLAHGVLAVGDCACVLPPQFGQSAATAIEDAAVLQQLLPVVPSAEALARAFVDRRLPRTQAIYELSTRAVRWDLVPEKSTDFLGLMRELTQVVALAP